MKKCILICMLFCAQGCMSPPSYPPEMLGVVKKVEMADRAYIEHMKAGKTTRAQDIKMMEKNHRAWKTLVEILEAAK